MEQHFSPSSTPAEELHVSRRFFSPQGFWNQPTGPNPAIAPSSERWMGILAAEQAPLPPRCIFAIMENRGAEASRIDYWLELAAYDLETAQAILAAGRYLYVGFTCHLTIEKALKAAFVACRNEVPPFRHNLLYLAEQAGLASEWPPRRRTFSTPFSRSTSRPVTRHTGTVSRGRSPENDATHYCPRPGSCTSG